MLKIACLLSFFLMISCSRTGGPPKKVNVQIVKDGSCLIDGRKVPCETVGPDLVAAYPGNEIQIALEADPDAEYASLGAVLRSIRAAGIENTLMTQQQ